MKRLQLLNALIWASLILLGSYLFKDVPNYEYFFMALLLGAGLTNSLIASHAKPQVSGMCS